MTLNVERITAMVYCGLRNETSAKRLSQCLLDVSMEQPMLFNMERLKLKTGFHFVKNFCIRCKREKLMSKLKTNYCKTRDGIEAKAWTQFNIFKTISER